MNTMKSPKAEDVRRGISVIWEILQCPICLELMSTPVSTKCDHQFCKFCIMKLLDSSRRKEANCPVCKTKITKRSLQESPGFQKLAEGLQNMVQAYEHDTCTNYFTGMSQMRRHMSVTETVQKKNIHDVSSDDVWATDRADGEDHEFPMSCSSTIAAKDGFAKLMGLEDSCPVISDEGFDSGLGDIPPATEKDTDDSKATSTTEKRKAALEAEIPKVVERAPSRPQKLGKKITTHPQDPPCRPEKVGNQPVRRSSRNNKRESLTEMIDQNQKKSLEKVSEWLMNNSSTEVNSEKEKNTEGSDDSVSLAGSCSASSPLEDNLRNKDESPKREERGKCLEELVFGAVYKRDRRGNRSFSPQNRAITEPPPPCPAEELPILKKIAKRRMRNKLIPADFVKRPRSEENEDSVMDDRPEMTEPQDDSPNEHPKDTEENKLIDLTGELNSNSSDKQGEELDELPDGDNKDNEDVEDSPVFDVPLREPGRKSNKKMHGRWQGVDGDLQGKVKSENNEQKKPAKKKGENIKVEKSKAAKSLVLVGVGEGGSDPKIPKSRPSGQTEVQIESYPSSEDPGSPIMRRTRRSRRLQLFTEEVQGSNKKIGTATSTKVVVLDSDCNKMQQSEEAKANTDRDNVTCLQNQNTEKSVRKNGCVLDEEMGGIENLDSSEKRSCEMIEAQKVNPIEESIVEVPLTGIPCHADIACSVTMVPSSISTPEASVSCAVPESVNQSNPVIKPFDDLRSNVPQETSASQAKCIDLEEDDRNDSELDTEQLVKSFKATKRKSFHLGSPNIKRSSFWSNKENTTLTKTQENKHVGTDMEAGNGQGFSRTTECPTVQQESEKRTIFEHSCCSDLSPPSSSPNNISQEKAQRNCKRLRKSILTRPPQDLVESSNPDTNGKTQKQILSRLSGNSSKSALSPNKVTKSQMESPHQAVGSGLLFPAFSATKEDLPDPTPVASKQLRVPKGQQPYKVEGSMMKSPTELESSHSVGSETAVEPNKTWPENMTGNMANTESSLTPDDLPIIQSVVIQEAERTKGSGVVSLHSPIKCTLKRRMAQRLESSSESDCSGEEEELPSLAQIFRSSACPPTAEEEEEEESVTLLKDHARDQGSYGEAGDGTCAAAEDGQRESSPLMCPSPEWVTTSQVSVDLFGTPEEAEGMAGDTGLTQESSQFSSECIATQQKVAMQEELRRLERMMALVSEALQEKEEEPTEAKVNPGAPYPPALLQPDRSTVSAGLDLQTTLPCGQGTRKRSASRESAQNIGGNAASPPPGLGDCEGLGPTPTTPCRTQHEGPGGTGAGRLGRQSGRSLRSSMRARPNQVSSVVRVRSGTNAPSAGLEVQDTPGVIQPANTHPSTHTPLREPAGVKLVLVASGLSAPEQSMVKKFAKRMGGSVCSQVTSETTHVIMNTDGDLVCERTLKYFLGIAGRKWVVSFQWISECFKQGTVLNETSFEVRGDVVNGHDHQGPMRARTTGDTSLLMKDYEICFQGPFTDMTTGQMEWMVELCGATVVQEPLLFTGELKTRQLIVVQPGSDQSPINYQALQRIATVITRGWLFDTVATYTLQSLDNYRT
ncbi:breast cancer type 1 susceptibility protein homolog [Salmo salar]|uniref:RING-type E3 ubiquitin transferase BRCA1 n=1 Tax=Salmo salar TaxID=8030 RepID=A0A1S3NGH2_SALSA|nr:breast cancer type 1 susceptibility protein homolog [Salmo salar]XP_014014234.1 breast cancer type 1 susceptibility protein homolog [Salmo salar]XP_014014236.1 breast cancer type 1 susceptibility protein homolog [Salmo salar]|eukprot:XP_014014234.1 PREDICTED: breast cancer type 1 susceptibility protein isoform X2 [Salmo salar]